ncbi:hypothetical protein Mgra_00009303 [Meloidogyne graminicola]|uniref:G-protein coupled receptors family 1 profile domain-containing protein n=1 Tax=Meloidogyne graminicola TaxID=189291 RepID=A0A8S9ZDD1_9BILA|nr:hypothetical protein Mgra_00009303 [Meloidogyne graminicola]
MGVGYLPILFIGLISDFISIRVFSAKAMRTKQINLYLLLISITDMFILLDTMCSFTAVGFGYLIKWRWLVQMSEKIFPYTYPLFTTLYTLSVWTTMFMHAHRYFAICYPFKTGRILTLRNTKLFLLLIIICAALFNIYSSFFWRARPCYSSIFKSEFVELYNINTSVRNALIYLYAYLAFVFFAPISALFFFNFMIILEVRNRTVWSKKHLVYSALENRSRKVHAEMKPDNSVKYQSMAREISISTMLVAVVCVFCHLYSWIYISSRKILWTVPWQHVLVMANQLINACIFYLFIDHYRRTVAKFLLPCRYISKHPIDGPSAVTEETNLQTYETTNKKTSKNAK